MATECLMCDFRMIKDQIFYEDTDFFGVYNIKAITPGHCFIMPKRHGAGITDFSEDEVKNLFALVRKVATALTKAYGVEGYNIGISYGLVASQSVLHLRVDIVPRRWDDGLDGWSSKIKAQEFAPNILYADIKENVDKIKNALGV